MYVNIGVDVIFNTALSWSYLNLLLCIINKTDKTYYIPEILICNLIDKIYIYCILFQPEIIINCNLFQEETIVNHCKPYQ